MAIAARAGGSWAIVTADAAVTIPATPQAGDRMFVFAAWKAFSTTAIITAPAGWNEVTEFADGAVAAGANVGSVKVGCWYKDWESGDTNPTLDYSTGPVPAAHVMVVFSKAASEMWDAPVFATAAIAAATNWTATAGSDPGITAGDLLIALTGFRDDSAVMSNRTLTATGVTFGTLVEYPATHASTTTSNDISADAVYVIATAGTSSAAPVTTGTLSASETGAALFIRQRVRPAPTGTQWTLTAHRGKAKSEASGATVSVAPTGNLAEGSIAVALFVGDNLATGGVGVTHHAVISDNSGSGNRWIKLGEIANSDVAGAAVLIAAFYCKVISLTTAHTVTVTMSSAVTAKGITLEEFAIPPGYEVFVAGGNGTQQDASAAPVVALNVGAGPSVSRVWIALAGREGDSDETFTQDTTFTNLASNGKFGTDTLTAEANVSAGAGYEVTSTDTTRTYNPTFGTARDLASGLWALDARLPSRYAGYVLSLSPRVYYRLGELAGTFCIDYAGQNPGVYLLLGGSHTYNTTSLLPDESNDGAHLLTRATSTSGPYIHIPHHTDLNLGDGPMSWVAWLQYGATRDVTQPLIDKGTNAYMALYWDFTTKKFGFYQSQVGLMVAETGTTDDADVHMLATSMAAGTNQKIYKDGVDVSGSVTDRTLVNTTDTLLINNEVSGFQGNTVTWDEVAGWPVELIPDQVLALYNIGKGTYQRPYRNPMPPLIAQ